jgi:hypothetical protein
VVPGHDGRVECRCTHVDVLYDTEATEYAEQHLVSDGEALVCPNTGARWRFEHRGPQLVLRQIDPEQHLTRRPQH